MLRDAVGEAIPASYCIAATDHPSLADKMQLCRFMKSFLMPMQALLCIAAGACGSDLTEPQFSPEPPASSVPTYKLAYTTGLSASVVVIESGKSSTTILPGSGIPVQPVWSPKGKRLAFATVSTSSQTLFVWDSDTNSLTQLATLVPATSCSKGSCTVAEPPFSPAWSGDGNRLAFLSRGILQIAAFDGSATQSVSSPTVVAVSNSLHWSFDGASLLFATDSSLLSVPDAGAAAFSTVASGFESGSVVEGFELSPDGKKIAIATTGKLYIRDVAAGTSITVDAASFFPPAWSPDGSRVAVVTGPSWLDPQAVFVVNRDGASFRRVTSELMFSRAAWLPDGMNVVYATGGGIGIANVAGGGTQVVGTGAVEFAVAPK
jgi:Tol biopolymer transport system component